MPDPEWLVELETAKWDLAACRAEVAALRQALEALPSIIHGMPGTVATPDCPFKACRAIRAALATRGGDIDG